MNSKQKRNLAAIFDEPTRTNIVWSDIESLFIAIGAEVSKGSGSRVRIALNGGRAYFHPASSKPRNRSRCIAFCADVFEKRGSGTGVKYYGIQRI